jgi:hypothetical protein
MQALSNLIAIELVHKFHNTYLIMWENCFTVLSTQHVMKACTVGGGGAGCIISLGITGEPLALNLMDRIEWPLRCNSPASDGDYIILKVPTDRGFG